MTDRRAPVTGVGPRRVSRSTMLDRIRSATSDMAPASVDRSYRQAAGPGDGDPTTMDPITMIDTFVDRLVDYRASVVVTGSGDAADHIDRFLRQEEARSVVVPHGFPAVWRPPDDPDRREVADDPALTIEQLDRVEAVVTGCALAIAETGTIVLDAGPGQGRRVLTLLPDLHVVVVRSDQLVAGVPEAVLGLDPTRPLTWISGPSATSDIELNRVEGVHGPRRLRVVVVTDRS